MMTEYPRCPTTVDKAFATSAKNGWSKSGTTKPMKVGPAGDQATGEDVWLIVQFLYSLENPFPCLLSDVRTGVEEPWKQLQLKVPDPLRCLSCARSYTAIYRPVWLNLKWSSPRRDLSSPSGKTSPALVAKFRISGTWLA